MEIIALIIGIFAILLCWVPMLGFILAVAAIIIGAFGIHKKNEQKKYAVTGLTLGCISLVVSIIITGMTLFITVSDEATTTIDSLNNEMSNNSRFEETEVQSN